MERLLTKSAFARLVGTTPGAVTHAIRNGRLFETEDKKIDLFDQATQKFMGERRTAAKPEGGGRGRPILGGSFTNPNNTNNRDSIVLTEAEEGKQLQNKLLKEKWVEKRIANMEKVGRICGEPERKRALSITVSVLEQSFRSMDQILAPVVFECAKMGGSETDIAKLIRDQIDRAMHDYQDAVKRAIKAEIFTNDEGRN